MSVTETTKISNDSLLNYCYEQLINRNSISDALQNIAAHISTHLNLAFCCITIKINRNIQTIQSVNNNYLLYTESNVLKIYDELVKLSNKNIFLTINNSTPALKNLMQLSSIQNIASFPITKEDKQQLIFIASSSNFDYPFYQPIFQKLIVAINNAILAENIKQQLYSHNEIYETSLTILNKLIWNFDIKTQTLRIVGFSPRIGNFIPQKVISIDDLWRKKIIHEDDIARVNKNYQDFLKQTESNTNEFTFRFIRDKDKNEYWWVLVRQTLLRDENGNPSIVVGTASDIEDEQQIAYELRKNNEILLQQVQETNERLNTILNSSKEIILTIDLQTEQIENINKAISILGYTPEEWIGQYYTQWSIEKRRKLYTLLKHASQSTTSVKSKQIIFSTKDNKRQIPFEFSTSIFSFKNKKYLLCVLRDVTERLEYEKNIEKVTNQLYHLINNIDDVYAIYNLIQNKYEFVSDNVEGLYGCSKEDFISSGYYWKEVIHKDDYASIVKQTDEIIKSKTKGEFFYRISTPVGETKMLLEKISVAVNKKGKAERLYIVKSDYTHIEKAEQSLIESERKFRFISENISDFISILDNDGRFLYASPSAEKVIGYNSEELIGKNFIYFIHPDDATSIIENALEKIVFDKEEAKHRYRILAKNNTYYWVETYFKPIIDATNVTSSIITSTRDVTETQQLMHELQQSLVKERELNELRSQFVSMASHQFRTPLTVIQSGIELMEIYLEGLTEQQQAPFKKQFKKINTEVTRLQDLMTDVLVLGRNEAQRTPFVPEEADLVLFCKELIESRYNNRYSNERKVILYVFGKEQKIFFDKKLLDHSLENILNNAYKYSEQGEIKMSITFEFDSVKISIQDKGIGIPPNDLENLFQPFYRASNTSEIEGTGLGLPIVKEFIDKHNGQIFVESEVNKGTTVNIILPLKNKSQ
ncbi:MAG: PAS domain S-box protein [Chitinophagales bacterium]|nr:PAS domain S-box protein [Chitinophagales bacterium]